MLNPFVSNAGIFNKKEESLFEIHRHMMENHIKMQTELDKLFDEQMKYMHKIQQQTIQSSVHSQNGFKKNGECKYEITISNVKKEEISITFEDRILSISGEKDLKNSGKSSFFYSFSVSDLCTGQPKVEHFKDKISISFETNSNLDKKTLDK